MFKEIKGVDEEEEILKVEFAVDVERLIEKNDKVKVWVGYDYDGFSKLSFIMDCKEWSNTGMNSESYPHMISIRDRESDSFVELDLTNNDGDGYIDRVKGNPQANPTVKIGNIHLTFFNEGDE